MLVTKCETLKYDDSNCVTTQFSDESPMIPEKRSISLNQQY